MTSYHTHNAQAIVAKEAQLALYRDQYVTALTTQLIVDVDDLRNSLVNLLQDAVKGAAADSVHRSLEAILERHTKILYAKMFVDRRYMGHSDVVEFEKHELRHALSEKVLEALRIDSANSAYDFDWLGSPR